jgi:hypothetical protein
MSNANENDLNRQPSDVSEAVRNYLEMTAAHSDRKRPPRQPDGRRRRRNAPIDNEGLSLEEGNDFA